MLAVENSKMTFSNDCDIFPNLMKSKLCTVPVDASEPVVNAVVPVVVVEAVDEGVVVVEAVDEGVVVVEAVDEGVVVVETVDEGVVVPAVVDGMPRDVPT